MIDVESDLWNIGRHYQKAGGYKPSCPDLINNGMGDGLPCGGGVVRGLERCQPKLKHYKECSFNQLDTRSVLPPSTLRGIAIEETQSFSSNTNNEFLIFFGRKIDTCRMKITKTVHQDMVCMSLCWLCIKLLGISP